MILGPEGRELTPEEVSEHDKGTKPAAEKPEGYVADQEKAYFMADAGNDKETLASNFESIDPEAASKIRDEARAIEEQQGEAYDEATKLLKESAISKVKNLIESGEEIVLTGLATLHQKESAADREKKMIETALKIDPANGRGIWENQHVLLSNIPGIFKMYENLTSASYIKDPAVYNKIKQESLQQK